MSEKDALRTFHDKKSLVIGLFVMMNATAYVANATWSNTWEHLTVGAVGLFFLLLGFGIARGWGR